MIEQVPWWSPLVGYALGWLIGRLDRETQDRPLRRFNHENRRGPVGPPPLKLRRREPEPPQDPSAQFIGYLQWKNRQKESALRDSYRPNEK